MPALEDLKAALKMAAGDYLAVVEHTEANPDAVWIVNKKLMEAQVRYLDALRIRDVN